MHTRLYFILAFICGVSALQAQIWELIQPKYATEDAFVADVSFRNLVPGTDGTVDVTDLLQERIDLLAGKGGGTLFIPEGRYAIYGSILLKKGVILRGERKKPTAADAAVKGTILMAFADRGNPDGRPFITMQPVTGLQDLSIWYPDQLADYVVPYPTTIFMGDRTFWGNDYCNVKHVSLVNSYVGIEMALPSGGTCPVIYHVWGTPLKKGVEFDNINDIGRIDYLNFSPDYWINSGLPNAPTGNNVLRNYMISNSTGVVIRRNDWSYLCNSRIDGYKTGLHLGASLMSPGTLPNGHNYGLEITRCHTGIYFENSENVGAMFARVKVKDCENAIAVGAENRGQIQFHTSEFEAKNLAINAYNGSNARIMMQKCKILKGGVSISGGTLMASDCDFTEPSKKIILGPKSRYILTGNRFINPGLIEKRSVSKSILDTTPVALPALPAYTDTLPRLEKPGRIAFYQATKAPFGVLGDNKTDNTNALQKVLDKAAAEGGGIVFLPPGRYLFRGEITIPSGVELKGALDIGSAPMGPGTILHIYAGKGSETGRPFIKMEKNSGLRGIILDYPEQNGNNAPNFLPYPFCVQVAGSNVYIVNVSFRGAYNGIDLFSHKADRHYVEYAAGSFLKRGIVVGGGTDSGKISNSQINPISFVFGEESKFGGFWENAAIPANRDKVGDYILQNLEFLHVGNCTNQTLYNCFVYGAVRGLNMNGGSGIALGLGIDGAMKSMVVQSIGANKFDFINSQIVSINNLPFNTYIETTSAFNSSLRLFNADFWGLPQSSITAGNGSIELYNPVFYQNGSKTFADIQSGKIAAYNMYYAGKVPFAQPNKTGSLSIFSSILDPKGVDTLKFALWKNNLSHDQIWNDRLTFDRSKWRIRTSLNDNLAFRAIDGDLNSRWDTGKRQEGGEWLWLDLLSVQDVNEILLDFKLSYFDQPQTFKVYLSIDDLNWTEVAEGPGTPGELLIQFKRRKARYIRMVQTGQTQVKWWSIHELYVWNNPVDAIDELVVQPAAALLEPQQILPLQTGFIPGYIAAKPIQWTSENPGVANVDTSGTITAKSPGVTLIRAYAPESGITAYAAVRVVQPVKSIALNPKSISMSVDERKNIAADILPVHATIKKLVWKSADSKIATVTDSGVVHAKGGGNTWVYAYSVDGAVGDSCRISVKPGFTVYAYRPPTWSAPLKVYWWEAVPALPSVNWPGVNMDTVRDASTNWYQYPFDSVQFTNIIFNDARNQTRDMTRTKIGWFVNEQWYDRAPWFATEIETDKTEMVFNQLNEKQRVKAALLPTYVLDRNLTFRIENPLIAAVTPDGEVSPKMHGNTKLIITSGDQKVTRTVDITVQLSTSTSHEIKKPRLLSVYPNPVLDNLSLEYKEFDPSSYTLRVVNTTGQVLHKMDVTLIDREGIYTLNVSNLPGGVYFLELSNHVSSSSAIFIK